MLRDGFELPEGLPFPQGCPASTVNLHQVLVVLLALHDPAGALPPSGVVAHQVLQLGEVRSIPLLSACDVPPGHGLLPVVQQLNTRCCA